MLGIGWSSLSREDATNAEAHDSSRRSIVVGQSRGRAARPAGGGLHLVGDVRACRHSCGVSPLEEEKATGRRRWSARERFDLDMEEDFIEEGSTPRAAREPRAPHTGRGRSTERPKHTYHTVRGVAHACRAGRETSATRGEGQGGKRAPNVAFVCAFLGSDGRGGGGGAVALPAIRERVAHVMFAHVVPRKGLSHKHGYQELLKDTPPQCGHREVIRAQV